MKPGATLLLTRREVTGLLGLDECIEAVEWVFKMLAEGNAPPPAVLGVHARAGGFHVKAGLLDLSKTYFVAKVNANFPHNMERFGLPLIQGLIVLADGENGYPLALMDSIEITIMRTGAATAVATNYLSRPDARVITICGTGNQGRVSLRAISKVRKIERAFAYDNDEAQAERFADELSNELGIQVEPVNDLMNAVRRSDICVTCTPSKHFFLKKEYVAPGTFIAAVGADNEDKQELEPALMQGNKLVVDSLEQCAAIGDLHHALADGIITRADVHAELGDVIAGKKPGRITEEEIIIFDSTGLAVQDVIAAATVYERAVTVGGIKAMDFFA